MSTVDGRTTRTIAVESDGSGGGRGRDPVARPRRLSQHELPRGLAAAIEGRPLAVRGHRRRDELGQVPRRRATSERDVATRSRIGARSPGSARTCTPAATSDPARRGTTDDGDRRAWPTRRATSGCTAIAAVGTAGLRAPGQPAGDRRDPREHGVRIEVISGEEEGRLAYLATTSALGPTTGELVVSIRAAAVPVHVRPTGEVDEQFSVPVGAVRFTEQFGLAGAVGRAVVEAGGRHRGRAQPGARRSERAGLIGMGGAVTNLAAVKHALATYDPEVIVGDRPRPDEIERQ